jgi:hypothetical protein
VLDFYREWLGQHRGRLEALGIRSVPAAIRKIDQERRSMIARAELVQLPFVARALGAGSLWLSGGYRYFYGWKSAIRDLGRRA